MCTQRMMVIKIMIMTQPNIRFLIEKRTDNEEDNSEDYFENAVYEDSVNFSSMADYSKTFLYGELIIKTSSYKQIIKDLLIF